MRFALLVTFLAGSACGSSTESEDDGGVWADSGSADAECGVIDPCLPDDVDADDDGVPDRFDPEPEVPQPEHVAEDFDQDPGWMVEGDGEWEWSPDGWIDQAGACDDHGTATLLEPTDAPSLGATFVETLLRVPACADRAEGGGAGAYVRRSDGQLLACLFRPIRPEENDPADSSGQAGIQIVSIDGPELDSSTVMVLGEQSNIVPMNDEDSAAAGPHWGERWLIMYLLIDEFDIACEVRSAGDAMEGWALEANTTAPEAPLGTAGLVTIGASATFDDFRVIDLD